MKISQSFNLGDDTLISSMSKNREGCITITDENGGIYLLKENGNFDKINLSADICPTDHIWLSKSLTAIADSKFIKVIDIETEKEVLKCVGHHKHVLCLKESDNHQIFLSGGDDSCVFAWDMRTQIPFNFVLGHSGPVTSLDITSDNSIFLSTSDDGYCRKWDMHDGICLGTVSLPGSPPLSYAKLGKTSRTIFLSTLEGNVQLYDTEELRVVKKYQGYENHNFLVEFDFSLDHHHHIDGIFVGSENGKLHKFRLNDEVSNSIQIEDDATIDLIRRGNLPGEIYATGRTLSTIYKIDSIIT